MDTAKRSTAHEFHRQVGTGLCTQVLQIQNISGGDDGQLLAVSAGKYMVSSGDGVEMLLWKASETEMPQGNLEEARTAPWRRVAVLR